MIRWAADRGNPTIVLTHDTQAKSSAGIRWFTRNQSEIHPSIVNHVAHLLRDLWGIVEALFEGIVLGDLGKYDRSPTTWGVIIEIRGFTEEQHAVADGAALEKVGLPYNFVAFLRSIPDGLLSKVLGRDVHPVRSLRIPWARSVVCSGLCVRVHEVAGWIFMALRTVYKRIRRASTIRIRAVQVLAPLPHWQASPDDIWDDCFDHRPMIYRVVGEINPHLRPKDLPGIYAAKIEHDLAGRVPVSERP